MAKAPTKKKLAVLKTKENNADVEGFLQAVSGETKRKDDLKGIGAFMNASIEMDLMGKE